MSERVTHALDYARKDSDNRSFTGTKEALTVLADEVERLQQWRGRRCEGGDRADAWAALDRLFDQAWAATHEDDQHEVGQDLLTVRRGIEGSDEARAEVERLREWIAGVRAMATDWSKPDEPWSWRMAAVPLLAMLSTLDGATEMGDDHG